MTRGRKIRELPPLGAVFPGGQADPLTRAPRTLLLHSWFVYRRWRWNLHHRAVGRTRELAQPLASYKSCDLFTHQQTLTQHPLYSQLLLLDTGLEGDPTGGAPSLTPYQHFGQYQGSWPPISTSPLPPAHCLPVHLSRMPSSTPS